MTAGTRRTAAALVLAFLLLGAVNGGALEIRAGRVRLVLHERIGRFSLYLLAENRDDGMPLLVDQDPRTSSISVSLDNRVYRLGESPDFREKVEKTSQGGRFTWDSARLRVTLDLTLISSRPTEPLDAVQLTLIMRNTSDSPLKTGVRVLLDTYLGEDGGPHFTTSTSETVERETTFTHEAPLEYWTSLSPRKPGQIGLQCLTMGEAVTVPDRIVMANWKRLNESAWGYDTAGARNFNHLPYSINDSAVGQYYEPRSLGGGEERRIVLVMGAYNPRGYAAAAPSAAPQPSAAPAPVAAPASPRPAVTRQADGPQPALPPASEAPSAGREARAGLRAALEAINTLMSEIDSRLGSVPGITEEELQALEQRLGELNRLVPSIPGGS